MNKYISTVLDLSLLNLGSLEFYSKEFCLQTRTSPETQKTTCLLHLAGLLSFFLTICLSNFVCPHSQVKWKVTVEHWEPDLKTNKTRVELESCGHLSLSPSCEDSLHISHFPVPVSSVYKY